MKRYCGVYKVNTPIEGVGVSVDSIQRLDFPGIQLTAVTSRIVNGKTVVYMGSSKGQIDKVIINNYCLDVPVILVLQMYRTHIH